MTGSGKTGLCITLLEEAALDAIPAIAIDPKGDLGNLLLTFPELRPADFRPWIDPAEAERAGRSPDEHARAVAELWRKGLAEWGQDGARIARLRAAVDVALYTPGSSAGRPLSVLRSFDAPPPSLAADPDLLRERVGSRVAGLLALVGVEADPLRSREHILLARLLEDAWRAGRSLDLAGLVHAIQSPGVSRVGVVDLESFFPAPARFELAMRLNALLASPGFAGWLEGEPLDVARLLYTEEGRPRLSILSIAHLPDAERTFFVTLLLSELVAWMRGQPGTQSLRALLFMDEVFGFLPPSANPPAKLPMLTLLKQARAYGLGVVLATQNPVDLDYKALANAGTWFLGRLQTERDKARVLDGLEGAAAGARFERAEVERLLSGLRNRVFLMSNAHDDGLALFQTRWALSYLRGPLTREEIRRLRVEGEGPEAHAPEPPPAAIGAHAPPEAAAPARAARPARAERPLVEPGVEEAFLPPAPGTGAGELRYEPHLLGVGTLHFVDARAGVDEWRTVAWLAPLAEGAASSPWERALERADGPPALEAAPRAGACFAPAPPEALRRAGHERFAKQLASQLQRAGALRLLRSREPALVARPGESEGELRVRVRQALHEGRDQAMQKLRAKQAPRLARLEERIARAQARLEREQGQLQQRSVETAISVGATVLGALFGRKLRSLGNVGRATTAARGASRTLGEREDVAREKEQLEALRRELAALEAELAVELDGLRASFDREPELEEIVIRPRKSDVGVERVALVWVPEGVHAAG
jgi:hypothetical protein